MGAHNTQNSNVKFYKLKAKADETNTPAFVENVKVEGKWTKGTPFNTISGALTGAEIKDKEYEGVKSKVFILTFTDPQEVSKVEFTHNQLTHSIINCLSGMDNFLADISITVGKTSGKIWGTAYVNTNLHQEKPDMVKWGFDPKTAPAKEQVMVNGVPFLQNGKPVFDDTKQRAFYEEVFLLDVVGKFWKMKTEKVAQPTVTDDEELPF